MYVFGTVSKVVATGYSRCVWEQVSLGFSVVDQCLSIMVCSSGLYDMMGNAWEWTSTPFPGAQPMYVLRGASWIDTADGSANHKARITTR